MEKIPNNEDNEADGVIDACLRQGMEKWAHNAPRSFGALVGASPEKVDQLIQSCLDKELYTEAYDAIYIGASEEMKRKALDELRKAIGEKKFQPPPSPPLWYKGSEHL